MWHITIRLARIWLYAKMRPYGEPSNGLAALSPSPFWPGYITNMSGYNFRKGQAYLVRDNDGAYGHVFTSRVRAMGIRDRPISPGSPWQNGYAERLIGTLRRECLDRVLIFGESHLRRILVSYTAYYNQARTHLALQKDALCLLKTSSIGGILVISDPKAPETIKFS